MPAWWLAMGAWLVQAPIVSIAKREGFIMESKSIDGSVTVRSVPAWLATWEHAGITSVTDLDDTKDSDQS